MGAPRTSPSPRHDVQNRTGGVGGDPETARDRPEDILRKELSLAGYQRPLDPRMFPPSARTFFQVGEFVGWIIEAPERDP